MSNNNNQRSERLFRNILIPLDGSEAAETVLELARNLAARSGAALTLLNVCRPSQTAYERMHRAYIDRITDLVCHDLSELCKEVTCHFEGVSATILPAVVTGEPAEEIVNYAEQNEASIILMATHGRGGSRNPIISDTTNRVIRNSLIPVWLIRTLSPKEVVCAEWPPARVMVPLDGSKKAECVLPYATEYAKLFDAEMVLFSVCEEPEITADYPEARMTLSWDEHVKRMLSSFQGQCSLYVNSVQERFKGKGIKVSTATILGDAAGEIINYIRQNRCDLVAMTTQGRSSPANWVSSLTVGRWYFSNVTEQVLAATSRGILVVRGQ